MVYQDPIVLEFCQFHEEADAEALVIRLCRDLLARCPTEKGKSPLDVLGSIQLIRSCTSGNIPEDTKCSGLLIFANGGYTVIVKADEPVERQYFSFAHEIVHTFFREVCPNVVEPSSEEEHLCEIGAAELTMPIDRFSTLLDTSLLSFAHIEHLRQEFGVSFEASARRAASLSDESVCFFTAALARTHQQDRQDSGQPILRIVSWTASKTWTDDRNYKNLPISLESIIANCFANLDEQCGHGPLGLPINSIEYDIEARGYAYMRPSDMEHRRVIALAIASGTETESHAA